MNDKNMLRGLLLAAISLAFGLGALGYPIGTLSRAGAGLFPLMVSALLLLVAIATIVRARMVKPVPLDFNLRSIGLVLFALCGFAVVSMYLRMVAGIVFLVFAASLAGSNYSWKRCAKVSLGLVAVAFGFQQLLGLNLPLY